MATEINNGKGLESPRHEKSWFARWHNGLWYCVCPGNHPARYLTVKKENENKGRTFWKCFKHNPSEQCQCFIWTDEEHEARQWVEKNGRFPPVGPSTPNKGTGFDNSVFPITPEASSSRSRKRAVSREASDGENENTSPGTLRGDEMPEDECMDSTPSRKATKRTAFAIPSQSFGSRLGNGAGSIPTPNGGRQAANNELFTGSQPPNTTWGISPTVARLRNVLNQDNEGRSNLTLAVLGLLHSKSVELDDDTTKKMSDKIDTAMELQEIEISKLSNKVAELESLVTLLRG